MNEEYYQKQIIGLFLIVDDAENIMISRDYIKEKLQMILHGGIGFHPVLKEPIDKIYKKLVE